MIKTAKRNSTNAPVSSFWRSKKVEINIISHLHNKKQEKFYFF